jgi:hypothetical protein
MQEMLVRAVLGGIVVSSFAVLGDVLKPKSFAGLFGAARSVALATLALTIHVNRRSISHGNHTHRDFDLADRSVFVVALHQRMGILPSGGLGLVLVIVIVLLMQGHI